MALRIRSRPAPGIKAWEHLLADETILEEIDSKVEAQTTDGNSVTVELEPFGITDLRIGARVSLLSDRMSETELVLATDLTLPSHFGTYGQDSVDLRYSFVGSQRLDRFLFFGNIGAAFYGDRQEDGFTFDSGSLDAVLGSLISLSQDWSLQFDEVFETSAVSNGRYYPSWTSYFDMAVQYQLNANWILSLGVRENPINGRETTDATGMIGLKHAWSS